MTERARRNWFFAVAAVILAAVAVMSWVVPDPQESDEGARAAGSRERSGTGAQRPRRAVIQGAPAPGKDKREPQRPASEATPTASPDTTKNADGEGDAGAPPPSTGQTPGLRAAERDARTFVEAFLHYEVGDLTSRVKRTIRSYATQDLARSLLANPPRMSGSTDSQPRGRLTDIANPEEVDSGRVQAVASIDRAGQRTSLLLMLAQERNRWRVTAMG